jgi:hypothetical protein
MADKHIHLYFSDALFKDAPSGKSQNASEAAAVLGHFGGAARAAVLAPGRRKQIAVKAAKARWRKKKAQEGSTLTGSTK